MTWETHCVQALFVVLGSSLPECWQPLANVHKSSSTIHPCKYSDAKNKYLSCYGLKPYGNFTQRIRKQKTPNLAALDVTARTAVGVGIAVLSQKWPFYLLVLRFPAVFVILAVVRRVARQQHCVKGGKQFVSSLICEIWHSHRMPLLRSWGII